MNEEVRAMGLHSAAASIASQTVHNVMVEAEVSGEHTLNTWTLEGDQHHIGHAQDHLRYSPSREDLEHAICRLAMAIWCQEHDVLGDNGREGVGGLISGSYKIAVAADVIDEQLKNGIPLLGDSAPERPWGEVCSH